jgi:hypothetical protein
MPAAAGRRQPEKAPRTLRKVLRELVHKLALWRPGGGGAGIICAVNLSAASVSGQPIDAMGRALVAALVHQIEGSAASAEELLFEPELVVRGSTGPVARPPSAG